MEREAVGDIDESIRRKKQKRDMRGEKEELLNKVEYTSREEWSDEKELMIYVTDGMRILDLWVQDGTKEDQLHMEFVQHIVSAAREAFTRERSN